MALPRQETPGIVQNDYSGTTTGIEEDMAEGIQIVSDGTVEGTRVLLDGATVKGVTQATWRFNARERKATLVLEMRDITLDVGAPIDPSVAEALAKLTA